MEQHTDIQIPTNNIMQVNDIRFDSSDFIYQP